ncbi:MAG: hypothetical protein V1736_09735 [Pseudomonadota bacterium]
MATLTQAIIELLVRSDLNETTTTMLSETELHAIIADGGKDVTAKGLCNEVLIDRPALAAERIITLIPTAGGGEDLIRVNYVEYITGATWAAGLAASAEPKGMICCLPQAVGFAPITTGVPQYWFQWGNYLIIEPVPTAATYSMKIHAACYPTSEATLYTTIPTEFHECIYQFTLAFAALKLKRWADFANAYNKYIADVQRKRMEYITKYPEGRISHEIPDSVTMEEKRG